MPNEIKGNTRHTLPKVKGKKREKKFGNESQRYLFKLTSHHQFQCIVIHFDVYFRVSLLKLLNINRKS